MLDYVLIALAVLALAGVVFEEVIHVNKAKTTLFFGTARVRGPRTILFSDVNSTVFLLFQMARSIQKLLLEF